MQALQSFKNELLALNIEGEMTASYGQRTVLSTDNSVYQVFPQFIIFPKHQQDLQHIATLLEQPAFHDLIAAGRGGGTGTNGQSLTDGIVIDCSRHMNNILEINAKEGWVRAQSGVVKDQLNSALKAHGLFFAPELSTSNRATLGGMISTDASGQGSVMYGKTRDHVLELKTVLLGGDVLASNPVSELDLETYCQRDDKIGAIYRTARDIHSEYKDEIQAKFPPLNRCLTGYDLAHIRDDQGKVNLNNLICGSEGTLGFISEAKLNVLPIPKVSALVCIRYDSFEISMRDAQALMACKPASIETVDSKVLGLAKDDIIWDTVAHYFPDSEQTEGINLVEFTADSDEALSQSMQATLDYLQQADTTAQGFEMVMGSQEVNKIWAMRKKSVGLLGNAKGEARPIPFVEDTAVPPENLADFIMEFRALLDRHNLQYGMFGHVDAGVLHVRPAIDMKDESQIKMIRTVTDGVVTLVQKYNGLLWGEHGKGLRSEFSPEFFGDLWPQIQRVKSVFDSRNQLNPGKIATPLEGTHALSKIDEVATRGDYDRTIPKEMWQQFQTGMYCNGNGACYNWDPSDVMCPSWKVSRDRAYSPKGRSSLIREWLRLNAEKGVNTVEASAKVKKSSYLLSIPKKLKNSFTSKDKDFSHEVYDSMATCLSCKSCAGSCPIKVDVPEFRSRFLEIHHGNYFRPIKDYVVAVTENIIPVFAKARLAYNIPMSLPPVKALLKHVVGMVDSPLISKINLAKSMKQQGFEFADASKLNALTEAEKANSVIVVQDAFFSYFDPQVVLDLLNTCKTLGFTPYVMPFSANGKPLHVHGFLKSFTKVAKKTALKLKALQDTGVSLIGVDPAMTLAYRGEYVKYVGEDSPKVELMQEFLARNIETIKAQNIQLDASTWYLLGHCTEKANAPAAQKDWVSLFDVLGLKLEHVAVGCCGMAGTYGHETRNLETSKELYAMSWKDKVNNLAYQDRIMASGYSCRSQVKRIEQTVVPHPIQVLVQLLK